MKNRTRLHNKVIKKAYKIKFVEVQFIGRFEHIPGYRFSTNMGPCDIEKYGYLTNTGHLKPGLVVTRYATDCMYKPLKNHIALYREAPNFEPDLHYFEHKVEQSEWEMKMFYEYEVIEPKQAIITTNA